MLPIFDAAKASPTEIKLLAKVEKFAGELLRLNKLLSTRIKEGNRVVVERKIRAIETAADGAVYQLYGLTKEQVARIERDIH